MPNASQICFHLVRRRSSRDLPGRLLTRSLPSSTDSDHTDKFEKDAKQRLQERGARLFLSLTALHTLLRSAQVEARFQPRNGAAEKAMHQKYLYMCWKTANRIEASKSTLCFMGLVLNTPSRLKSSHENTNSNSSISCCRCFRFVVVCSRWF